MTVYPNARVLYVHGTVMHLSDVEKCRKVLEDGTGIKVKSLWHSAKIHSSSVSEVLQNKIIKYTSADKHVCVIAYGEGCQLLWTVLNSLPALNLQKHVYAYGFGGEALLEPSFGKDVENFQAQGPRGPARTRVKDSGQLNAFMLPPPPPPALKKWKDVENTEEATRFSLRYIFPGTSDPTELHDFQVSYASTAIGKINEFREMKSKLDMKYKGPAKCFLFGAFVVSAIAALAFHFLQD